MMNNLCKLAAIILLCQAVSCSKKPMRVDGQILGSTTYNRSIQMPGIRVYTVSHQQFLSASNKVLPWLEIEIQKISQETNDCEHMINFLRETKKLRQSYQLSNETRIALEKLNNSLKNIDNSLIKEASLIIRPYTVQTELLKSLEFADYGMNNEALNNLPNELPISQQALVMIINSVESKQETTTDMDGRFTHYISEKTWFLAKAERGNWDNLQQYCWFKSLEPVKGAPNNSMVISDDDNHISAKKMHSFLSNVCQKSNNFDFLYQSGKIEVSEKMKSLVAKKKYELHQIREEFERDLAEARKKAQEEARTSPQGIMAALIAEERKKAQEKALEAEKNDDRKAAEDPAKAEIDATKKKLEATEFLEK